MKDTPPTPRVQGPQPENAPASAANTTVVHALQQDLDMASRFLTALDHTAREFCFQTFDDSGRKDKSLARSLHGTVIGHHATLAALNSSGAGVFVAINEVEGGKPRQTQNVIRVRALFADADDAARLSDVEAAIERLGLTPSIIVESSPGKRHFYWRVRDCPLTEFKAAQQALAAAFGTDPAVCDLPRVMRLPGFHHHKGTPFMVRLVSAP